jgi:YesN/AraC family two-component response regulator
MMPQHVPQAQSLAAKASAAFNRAFKKFTGLTPTEYKKQIT